MNKLRLSLAAAFFVLTVGGASANTVFEQVFKTGMLEGIKPGDVIEYQEVLNDPVRKIDHQKMGLFLKANDKNELEITLKNDDGEKFLGAHPKDVGNPTQMYFLEKIISYMAADTGGSNFYIRNRLKDALSKAIPKEDECLDSNGNKIKGQCIVIMPFEKDEARKKMGDFADLQLYFSLDEGNPAWITGLHAKNPAKPDGFSMGLDLIK